MRFILTGFTPQTDFRVFAFQGIREDNSRTEFTVRTDLSLIRKYGIRVQELPLLCRGLLERRPETEQAQNLTFSEEDMRLYQKDCVATQAAAAQKRKPPRKPPAENGSGWRTSPVFRTEGRV